jgi:hypothetical protein
VRLELCFWEKEETTKCWERKIWGFKGIEVSPSLNASTLIGGGVVKPGVGKSSKVLGLNHCTTSGKTRVSKLSPSKPRLGGEKLTGKLPKFKLLGTPVDGIIGELEATTGVFKEGL